MKKYDITNNDRNLIEIALKCLNDNFDDGVYNHTVGCALLCKNGEIYKGVNCDGIHGSCVRGTVLLTHDKKQRDRGTVLLSPVPLSPVDLHPFALIELSIEPLK